MPKRTFLWGFLSGLLAGIFVGLVLAGCGIFYWAKRIQNNEAQEARLEEKIEESAGKSAGKYPSAGEIADLAKVYLSDNHNFGLVIGICSNNQIRIFGFGPISRCARW